MFETPIEQCSRHVAEGAQRIVRQKDLIAHLERYGHARLLREAKGLLATLEHMQHLSEKQLAHEMENPCFDNKATPVVRWAEAGCV